MTPDVYRSMTFRHYCSLTCLMECDGVWGKGDSTEIGEWILLMGGGGGGGGGDEPTIQ